MLIKVYYPNGKRFSNQENSGWQIFFQPLLSRLGSIVEFKSILMIFITFPHFSGFKLTAEKGIIWSFYEHEVRQA